MISKTKTNIYKQLQYAIYLQSIYKNKRYIFSKLLEKVMGFISKKNCGVYMEVQKFQQK
jgi:hypothetical protein